jgi:uncharacterized protein
MRFTEAKKFILEKQRKELPRHLSYHSVAHVHDVYQAAKRLAKEEKIKGDQLTLLLTAVLFHDSGFLKGQEKHEEASCKIAQTYLPDYGYSEEQIEKICGMILATRIPQKPVNHLEQIICDADLDYLGRDDFFEIGQKLFQELKVYGIINDETEWDQLQIRFLEKHHYFTPTALRLRKDRKDAYLAQLKSKHSS